LGVGLLVGFDGQCVAGAGAEVFAADSGAVVAGEEAAVGAQVGALIVTVEVAVLAP
jgi:hypothetical protein